MLGGYERFQTNAEPESDARAALRGVDRRYRFSSCLALSQKGRRAYDFSAIRHPCCHSVRRSYFRVLYGAGAEMPRLR